MEFREVLLMWSRMQISRFIGHTLSEVFGKTDNWRQIYKETSLAFYTSNNVSLKLPSRKVFWCNKYISLKICWGSHVCEIAVYLVMKKVTLFLHKNTHHTISCNKSYLILINIFHYPVPFLDLFHGSGPGCFFYSSRCRLVYIRNSIRKNYIIYGL